MRKKLLCVIFALGAVLGVSGCNEKKILDKNNPTAIKIWHYYNGPQQQAFDDLVEEFNDTVGKEKGIVVESAGQGTINDLASSLMASINGDAGAEPMPDIFAAYADTAYQADAMGYVADLSSYFTDEELDLFVDGYVEEGRFSSEDSLKILPVAKSVELFMLNKTDWDPFAAETGAKKEELGTIEGICRTAEQYYEWTDGKTEEPGDGKAFFGRDSIANYMIIGYRQLSGEMFEVKDGKAVLNFDRETLKKLWDCYYIPYIKGYFSAVGRFRSDDIKTGDIISCVGSSSSATYFPKEVILSDEESYPIEMETFPCPKFEDGKDFAVQQGAGMVVTKSDEKKELASVEFLKWLTRDEQNIRFSIASGYVPVTKSANDIDVITRNVEVEEGVKMTLEKALETIRENEMYTTKAFGTGSQARNLVGSSMQDLADSDRETVKKNMEEGMTLEEASQPFCSEEYFDGWYQELKEQLEAVIRNEKKN